MALTRPKQGVSDVRFGLRGIGVRNAEGEYLDFEVSKKILKVEVLGSRSRKQRLVTNIPRHSKYMPVRKKHEETEEETRPARIDKIHQTC